MEASFQEIFLIQTTFTRYRYILKTVKNVTDRPLHTKTARVLPADFENGALTGTLRSASREHSKMMKIGENGTFFDAFKTRLINSLGTCTFL